MKGMHMLDSMSGNLTREQMEKINLHQSILNPGPHPQTVVTVWLAFQFGGGHILLVILLATFLLSKKLNRHVTLYNLLITFILAGVIDSMLLYADRWRISDPSPSPILCLIQGSLIYGIPPMNATAAFALIYQMWWTLYRPSTVSVRESPAAFKNQRQRIAVLLIMPYIAFVLAGVPTFVIGSQDPSSVSRQRRMFYCSVMNRTLTNSLAVGTGVVCCMTAFFEIWAGYIIYRSWRAISTVEQKVLGTLDRQSVLRVAFFGFYVILGLALSFMMIPNQHSVIPDLFLSTYPVSVFLVFATQADVLRVWAEWLHIDGLLGLRRPQSTIQSQPSKSFNIDPEPVIPTMTVVGRSAASSYIRMPNTEAYSHDRSAMMGVDDSRAAVDEKHRPDDEESVLSSVRGVLQVQPKTPSTVMAPRSFDVADSPRPGGDSGNWQRQTPVVRTPPKSIQAASPASLRSKSSAEWI